MNLLARNFPELPGKAGPCSQKISSQADFRSSACSDALTLLRKLNHRQLIMKVSSQETASKTSAPRVASSSRGYSLPKLSGNLVQDF